MKQWIVFLLFIHVGVVTHLDAVPLKVVTTTSTLASITQEIGGEFVTVTPLVTGQQDLHYINARPSMIKDMQQADLFVRVGMMLDAWADGLIVAAKNKQIFTQKLGYLDVSVGVEKLDVPTGRIDGGMGDIHIEGNPHYYLDPINGSIVAKKIADRLCQLQPENAPYFRSRLAQFNLKISEMMPKWMAQLQGISGYSLITYHTTWRYFTHRFNLDVIGQVEPKPGIPPTASHLLELKQLIVTHPHVMVIQAEFHPPRPGQSLVSGTMIPLITVPTEVSAEPHTDTYVDLISEMVRRLATKGKST